jgi:23S rRNA (adenine2503-C2)-methyltransferase
MTTETDMTDLTGMDRELLCRKLSDFGMKPFRGNQVFQWIHKRMEFSFHNMTDLSMADRGLLAQRARIQVPALSHVESASDGTEKYLFSLEDGHAVEGVLIPEEKRLTLCVSTQVGCAMGCTFCLTGKGGVVRNLKTFEIVGQVYLVQKLLSQDRPLTHLVLMGMGEPLANYENTLRAVRILLDPLGANFSKRKITLSTCGLIPGIQKLASEQTGINLAVSLNASDTSTRTRLMPINRKYPMDDLLRVLRSFPLPVRGRITFEYVLLRGLNDSLEDARRLVTLLSGIRCKINLIPYNPIPDCEFQPPSREQVEKFQNILLSANYTAIIRESRGQEISAACGQLARILHE